MKVFASPGRYVQGPGALEGLGAAVAPYGNRPVVVMDSAALRPHVLIAAGEITYELVDALAAEVTGEAGVVIGVGGGKVLDTAKGIARILGRPVATVPTIASNDSPTSSMIAMYNQDHELISVDRLSANPVVVLVDTELIAAAPSVFLRSGIGDAISKRFEAAGCSAGTGVTPLGTRPLAIADAIGKQCYSVLRTYALQALIDCEQHRVTDAVERTVEAVVLLSGLAFENGGLSLAHSLTRGLMRVQGARDALHGFHVAWGTLVQLAAEGRPDEDILDLMGFLSSVGLPVCAADLGMSEPLDQPFAEIAHHTMTAPHLLNMPLPVDESLVIAAQLRVEALSRSRG